MARSSQSALKILQKHFAIVMLSGTHFGVSLDQVKAIKAGGMGLKLSLMKKVDADLAMRRFLEGIAISSDPKKTVADFWLDPKTKLFNQIAFDPIDDAKSTLNLWVDSPVIPAQGDWSIIRTYLADQICAGSTETFGYLMRFLAHMVQKPAEKPGVMIVLLGQQGVGKGLFFQLLQSLWPTTAMMVSDIRSIVTGFNASLESKFAVFLDEGLFHGDKNASERLKSLVTEPSIQIEEKYQPQRSIRSVHRFFAASNNDHYATVDRDDRRFLFLRVSSQRIGDFAYWDKLVAALKEPSAVSAMMFDLKNLDLSGFNIRRRPRTVEHATQKLKSLANIERFWFEVLLAGDLRGTDQSPLGLFTDAEPWIAPRFIATARLVGLIKTADPTTARFGIVQQGDVHAKVLKLCPSAKSARRAGRASGGDSSDSAQVRGIDLPSLAKARIDFEKYLGITINWEDGSATAGEVSPQTRNEYSPALPTETEGCGDPHFIAEQVATLAILATPKKDIEKNISNLVQTLGKYGNPGKFQPPSIKPLMSLRDVETFLKTTPRTREEDWRHSEKFLSCTSYRMNRRVWRITAALRTPTDQWRGEDQHTLFQVSYPSEAEYIEAVQLYQLWVCEELHHRFLPEAINLAYSMLIHYGGTHRQAFDYVVKFFQWFVPGLPALQAKFENAFDEEVAAMRMNNPSLMEFINAATNIDAGCVSYLWDEEFRYCLFNGLRYGYEVPHQFSKPRTIN